MMTTFERGYLAGQLAGQLVGQRRTVLMQMEAKFGSLSAEVKQRVESLAPEDLLRLLFDTLKATSLKELHLEPDSDEPIFLSAMKQEE